MGVASGVVEPVARELLPGSPAHVSFSGWRSLQLDGWLSACLGGFRVSPRPVLDQEPISDPPGW